MQINIKANFSTLGFKVSYKMILSLLIAVTKHSQNIQSNKFAISLQYFKKKVLDGVHSLLAYKYSTIWHDQIWWKWSDMSKVPRIGSWLYFCNIKERKCLNYFYVLLQCKIFRYFTGVQSCLLLFVALHSTNYITETTAPWW